MDNKEDNIKDFVKFALKQEDNFGMSDLWSSYIKDFDFFNSKIRPSYKTNRSRSNNKVLFQIKVINSFKKITSLLFKVMKKTVSTVINTLTLFGVKAVRDYGLYIPNTMFSEISSIKPKFRKELDDFHARHEIFYSFMSVKAFYNFYCFKNYVPVELFNEKNILEIGSGSGNLVKIFGSNLDSFNYVCLDLPQMIPHAYNELYQNPKVNSEVFLPNQIDQFIESKSKRKILFILPNQLDLVPLRYDLLNNVESFGEMPQTTVNNYINSVIPKMNTGATCFLINRVMRCTNLNDPTNHESWTMFHKYPLENFKTIVKKIDDFKDLNNTEEKNRCNVFYVGELT